MRKDLFIVGIICCMGLFFTSCKKYPEGGYENRGPKVLQKHSWILTLYEVNGIDSTSLINYNGTEEYKDVLFYKEAGKYNHQLYAENSGGFIYQIYFTENNSKITFSDEYYISKRCFVNGLCFRLFFTPEENAYRWNILKLNNNEFIIECAQKNTYKLKFKSKK